VGSQVCAGCHVEIAAQHAGSGHSKALARAGAHPAAADLARRGAVEIGPNSAIRFYRAGEGLRVWMMAGQEQTDLALDWAFGAGAQGVTFVSRLDEAHYLELGYSDFGASGLARTPGHAAGPKSLDEAIGLIYPVDGPKGIRSCFACHSTGGVDFSADGETSVGEIGVGCEACHGPGEQHLRDPARIGAGKVTAAGQLVLCGGCHRRPAEASAVDWQDPWNVRHAPVYLARSRCFQEGGLGCTGCHSPHAAQAKAEKNHYRSVCLQCHAEAHAADAAFADCVDCHMPRVKPHERLRFTNHWIGIYAEQAPLQPVRR
ncbi:MAG: multiheme c-type cytochrome, partial [Bryobacterales bacterium]